MSFVKLSSSALADIRQERSFESGEKVTFLCVVMGIFNVESAKFVQNEIEGKTRRQYSFLCGDGRKFQLSRLWGSRTTNSGRVLASDDNSPVQDLCTQLPFSLLDKLQTYLQRCGCNDSFADDSVIDAKIEKIAVEDSKSGFKDWYRLRDVTIRKITISENEPTTAQIEKLERFARNTDITIDVKDVAIVKWWIAALGL